MSFYKDSNIQSQTEHDNKFYRTKKYKSPYIINSYGNCNKNIAWCKVSNIPGSSECRNWIFY